MTNPAYIKWVWMTKAGEEDKLVHPNNVEAHRRQGWLIKSNPPPSVAVETEPAAESQSVEVLSPEQPLHKKNDDAKPRKPRAKKA